MDKFINKLIDHIAEKVADKVTDRVAEIIAKQILDNSPKPPVTIPWVPEKDAVPKKVDPWGGIAVAYGVQVLPFQPYIGTQNTYEHYSNCYKKE